MAALHAEELGGALDVAGVRVELAAEEERLGEVLEFLERGAFEGLPKGKVAKATFIGLKDGREVDAPLDETSSAEIWDEFTALIAAYANPSQGYTARRMLQKDSDTGAFDQLARFGEWDVTDDPVPEDLS